MEVEDNRIFSVNVTNAVSLAAGDTYAIATFNIPKLVCKEKDAVACYVSIENMTLPSSWYTLNDSNNQLSFGVFVSPGPIVNYNITLVEIGNYNSNTFANLLNSYLAALGIDTIFTFVYNIANNKMGIVWTSYTGPVGSYVQFFSIGTTIDYLLGLTLPEDSILDDELEENDFTNQCNLTGVNTYLIQCDEFVVKNFSVQVQGNIIGSIQNAAGLWGQTLWQNTNNIRYKIPKNKPVDQITIKIYDENGDFVDFRSQPWILTLKITYIKPDLEDLHDLVEFVDNANTTTTKPQTKP